MPHHASLLRWSVVTFLALAILLACRTFDLVTGNPVPPASELVSQAQSQATETEGQEPTSRPTRTAIPTLEPIEEIPPEEPPMQVPPPTELPAPPPTEIPTETPKPAPTKKPLPTEVPTLAGPTATAAPTRCAQQYCVSYRGCQPDGNTIIEGIVYNNGVPENGVTVRVAKQAGAYPLVDDFVSGNSSINPGQPDPDNPGRYILQIVAGAPREGHWWVFVVDRPNGTKQQSDAKEIHTHDDPFNPANCQHAFVDFVR